MSINVNYPPIFRLNADIFMHILEINGDMFAANEDALNTTRITSQVCRTWRDFMLNERSLWAHIIDFDSLEELRSTEWGQELIRRSGSVPLWIRAANDRMLLQRSCKHRLKFFFKVMRDNWRRTQKLVLNGLLLMQIGILDGPLTSPAPVLEMFHVMFVNSHSRRTMIGRDRSTGPLFRSLLLGHFSSTRLRPGARWVHKLHSITLDPMYDIHECFMLLSHTKYLQYLEITDTAKALTHFPHAIITLPKLRRLTLTLNFDKMAFFLDHLEIPPQCSVNLLAYYHKSISITPSQIMSRLSQASRPYLQSHPPRKIDITCLKSGQVAVRDNFYSEGRIFETRCRALDDFPRYATSISESLSLPEFSSVTELKLNYDIVPSSDLSFLRCFPSVEILHIDEDLLNHIVTQNLTSDEVDLPFIFPKLQVVVLQTTGRFHNNLDSLKLVLSRVRNGQPVSIIDVTAYEIRSQ